MKIFGTKRNAAHYERKGGKVRKVLSVLLVLALLTTGGVYAFMTFFIQPPTAREWVLPPEPPRPPAHEQTEPTPKPEPEDGEPLVRTLMVAGQDDVGERGLSDTIMLVRMDVTNGAVSVITVPRDLKVDEPWAMPKINSVYAWTGSIDRLMESVEALTGFLPDNYVMLDMQAFVDLVDAVGGVYFDVPRRMHYSDPYQDLYIDLHPGHQHLDGDRAIQLVRWRQNNAGTVGYADGDIGRIAMQQEFMGALARELLQIQNVVRIGEIAGIFMDHVRTDLELGAIAWYAQQLMSMDSENITFLTVPHIFDGPYVILILEEWLEMINTYLNPNPLLFEIREENLRVHAVKDGVVQLVGEGRTFTPGDRVFEWTELTEIE